MQKSPHTLQREPEMSMHADDRETNADAVERAVNEIEERLGKLYASINSLRNTTCSGGEGGLRSVPNEVSSSVS